MIYDSKLAKAVEAALKRLKIKYRREHIIKECKDVHPLRWDFFLPDIGPTGALLEADGARHFLAVAFSRDVDPVKRLEYNQNKDRIKNVYARSEKPLLRLPYTIHLATVEHEIEKFIAAVKKANNSSPPLQKFVGSIYETADYKTHCL